MSLNLGELRSSVRQDMMIDKNGRIWNDMIIDEKINNAISKVIGDLSHIKTYTELPLKEASQETLELFEIHKPCIVAFTSHLLFSMPSDARNIEKANFKLQAYNEQLKILLNKLWIEEK